MWPIPLLTVFYIRSMYFPTFNRNSSVIISWAQQDVLIRTVRDFHRLWHPGLCDGKRDPQQKVVCLQMGIMYPVCS